MQLAVPDVGPVLILVFAGLLMAEETESGTLQAVLTSPVARWEVYVAKALAGLVYMIVMSVACLALAAALGALRHDYGPVVDTLGEVYRVREVFANLLLACVASWVPLGALVMCGLLVSTLIRRPGAAVAVGLGMVYLIDFTKHLVGVDPYIFTRYISYPWQVLHHVAGGVDYQWTPELWRMIGLCGAYALGAGVTGLVVFRRQDLNA
jgi:ABC-type transport system involved in multi-copper enzyme maturation permease subunit